MRVPFVRLVLVIALFVISLSACSRAANREVAITIDDLPAGAANLMPAADISQMTTRLLTTLRDQKIPVVGFVNEKKLYKSGEVDERIAALRMWLDYGFELGNHTFSHSSLNQVGLAAWEDDIVQGESVTRQLLAEHNMTLSGYRTRSANPASGRRVSGSSWVPHRTRHPRRMGLDVCRGLRRCQKAWGRRDARAARAKLPLLQ
jgi:peptidoglycan/xylan/chitin deacetylase (PgdA/CDA1 family)